MLHKNLTPGGLWVCIFVFCLLSCGQKVVTTVDDPSWKSPKVTFTDSVTFIPLRNLEIHLDSATVLYYETCQFDETTNSIVSYNSNNSDMLFFDYHSGKLKWKLNLEKVGIRRKHRANPKSYSFQVINCDSIFFYDYEKAKVVLFDTALRVINTYAVKSYRNGYKQGRLVVGELLSLSNDSLYVSSAPGRDPLAENAPLRENLLLSISLKTGMAQPILSYPDIYKKARWGYFLHAFHALYDRQHWRLVISYPVDHSLNVYDSSGKHSRYYAGGREVNTINPYKYAGDKTIPKPDEEVKNFVSQRTYAGIYHDRFRGLYYRIVTCPIPAEDFARTRTAGYTKKNPMSVVILNSAFTKVGEFPVDANKYSITSMFISKEGLCIPLTSSDDDNLRYTVFTLQKNNR